MTETTRGALVESNIPGRMRVRLPPNQRHADFAQRFKSAMGDLDGVGSILVNLVTGGILILYDPEAVDPADLISAGQAADVIGQAEEAADELGELPWPEISKLGKRVVEQVRRLDAEIHKATNGVVDLKVLVPLLLLTMAVFRVVVRGERQAIPSYSLLWYAYSTFCHSHRPLVNTVQTNRNLTAL